MISPLVIAGIAGVFGLIVGSFLNVLVLRWGTGMTFGGRSQCFSCQYTLTWYDLVPVASYLVLRGRCRKCRVPISKQYIIVELLAGALAFLIVWSGGLTITSVFLVVISWILLASAVYDLRHMILPDAWTLTAGVLALVGQLFGWLPIVASGSWIDLLAGVIFAAPFVLLWYASKGRAMGFGDIKLILVLGLILGWHLGLSALLISFWVGAFVSLLWLLYHHWYGRRGLVTMQSPIPFGPFLVLATVFHMIVPVSILSILMP